MWCSGQNKQRVPRYRLASRRIVQFVDMAGTAGSVSGMLFDSSLSEYRMKILPSILLAASLLACSASFAQDPKDVSAAKVATESWLKLMDAEDYSGAWNNSAFAVKKDMPKFAWTMLASTVHLPLGTLKSRKFKSSTVKKAGGDKAGGETISFEYESQYEKNPKVSEIITSMQDKDGVWRVSGYNISDEKR
jgi:hypothetical protein